jgi:antitoxin MazE
MRVEVCRWGHSAAVRIPVPALKDAGLRVGQSLELRVEGGCLVLEPVAENLDALLAKVTPQNRHGLELMGPSVGPKT